MVESVIKCPLCGTSLEKHQMDSCLVEWWFLATGKELEQQVVISGVVAHEMEGRLKREIMEGLEEVTPDWELVKRYLKLVEKRAFMSLERAMIQMLVHHRLMGTGKVVIGQGRA